MINIEYTDEPILSSAQSNKVDAIIQGCNCFHKMYSGFSQSLATLTDGDIQFVDISQSNYGDINKLGTSTSNTYQVNDSEIQVFNLYCYYTLPADGIDFIHWESVYYGIIEILANIESGANVGIEWIGYDHNGLRESFTLAIESLSKQDDELPDVDITVFKH